MTTPQEKDSILSVVYAQYKKYGPSDSGGGSYNPYADYSSVRKETGLDENAFHIVFEELEEAGMLCITGTDSDFTFIEITSKGIYLIQKDGYTAIDRKQKSKIKRDRFWETANKIATLIVGVSSFIVPICWTNISNNINKGERDLTRQNRVIDSLANQVSKLDSIIKAKPATKRNTN